MLRTRSVTLFSSLAGNLPSVDPLLTPAPTPVQSIAALASDFSKLEGGAWGRAPLLKASLFPNQPPTVLFTQQPGQYNWHGSATGSSSLWYASVAQQYYSVRIPLLRAGFRRVPPAFSGPLVPNIILRRPYTTLPAEGVGEGSDEEAGSSSADIVIPQKINHFPGSGILGNKSRMCSALGTMAREFGRDFGFVPETYSIPEEWERALAMLATDSALVPSDQPLYILKPSLGSCGRGIRVIDRASAVKVVHSVVDGTYEQTTG
eukprot:RCo018488